MILKLRSDERGVKRYFGSSDYNAGRHVNTQSIHVANCLCWQPPTTGHLHSWRRGYEEWFTSGLTNANVSAGQDVCNTSWPQAYSFLNSKIRTAVAARGRCLRLFSHLREVMSKLYSHQRIQKACAIIIGTLNLARLTLDIALFFLPKTQHWSGRRNFTHSEITK